jgi:hypothetical protein
LELSATQLIAVFETNRTIKDLSLLRITNLEDAALGDSLSGLMQNMPQLQRLSSILCMPKEAVLSTSTASESNVEATASLLLLHWK